MLLIVCLNFLLLQHRKSANTVLKYYCWALGILFISLKIIGRILLSRLQIKQGLLKVHLHLERLLLFGCCFTPLYYYVELVCYEDLGYRITVEDLFTSSSIIYSIRLFSLSQKDQKKKIK